MDLPEPASPMIAAYMFGWYNPVPYVPATFGSTPERRLRAEKMKTSREVVCSKCRAHSAMTAGSRGTIPSGRGGAASRLRSSVGIGRKPSMAHQREGLLDEREAAVCAGVLDTHGW